MHGYIRSDLQASHKGSERQMSDRIITITGTVASGEQIGRTYGMPTANITPVEDISDLQHGVYYSMIKIDGIDFPAITDLGVRPTVTDGGPVRAETYIYGFEGDLYGKAVEVTLLKFCRSEKKFASLDELYETVKDDFRAGALYHNL